MNLFHKSSIVWLAIVILAVGNGVLREFALEPALGGSVALPLSGLLLSALIVGVAYVSLPWLKTTQPLPVWWVGLIWLLLTLVFEFSVGLWQGKPWPELVAAYTFKGWNLWPVVLGVTVCAPYLAARLRGWVPGDKP